MKINANNPQLKSWIAVPANSDFPIQNIPFGIFKTANSNARAATAIGNYVLDLGTLALLGYFDELGISASIFNQSTLNELLKLSKKEWRAVRERISQLLKKDNAELRDHQSHRELVLYPMDKVDLLMPVKIGDYTDFYASIEHATNIGTMFRGVENALMPNWLHLPVGYHGRASSIIVSNTPIHRPKGQMRPDDTQPPVFGECKLLDFELEVGYILGQGKELGHSISTDEAEDYVFGIVLFNDWSARDIQKWEYVPLGPFLGKNFASTISPWIVTLDALEPFKVAAPKPRVPILPYLQYKGDKAIDINLEVAIQPENADPSTVARSNFKYMYWTIAQQVAHHTVNGCNIMAGDMMASGTISGATADSYGSMLELSWRGSKPLKMKDGSERKFVLDGDTVIMKGHAQKGDLRIGFGEVKNKVLPAL